MSHIQTAQENIKGASRRIVIMGPMSSGKTTLAVSASAHAGNTIPAADVRCKDVILLSGDQEGVLGALDAGLTPGGVVDMTTCADWAGYQTKLAQVLQELIPMIKAGDVKIVAVDLGLPAKLLVDSVSPKTIADWGKVAAEGLKLYNIFNVLRGATIIAIAQIKSATAIVETAPGTAGAEAKAIGGERATFAIDLPRSLASPWLEHASLVLSREAKRVKDPMKKDAPVVRKFFTHTQSNVRFEAKSRTASKLLPTEPGERTLHSLLLQAYGDNL